MQSGFLILCMFITQLASASAVQSNLDGADVVVRNVLCASNRSDHSTSSENCTSNFCCVADFGAGRSIHNDCTTENYDSDLMLRNLFLLHPSQSAAVDGLCTQRDRRLNTEESSGSNLLCYCVLRGYPVGKPVLCRYKNEQRFNGTDCDDIIDWTSMEMQNGMCEVRLRAFEDVYAGEGYDAANDWRGSNYYALALSADECKEGSRSGSTSILEIDMAASPIWRIRGGSSTFHMDDMCDFDVATECYQASQDSQESDASQALASLSSSPWTVMLVLSASVCASGFIGSRA